MDLRSDEAVWNRFYEYKLSLACPKQFTGELRRFIDGKRYLLVTELIKEGGRFPIPRKSVISKMGSDKKRVVYTYPEDENTVLKLLTWLILRKYDRIFSRNLYSFRPGRTAKDAVRDLLKTGKVSQAYSYKVDIHDYFNSVPVERLLPMLKNTLEDDEALYSFLEKLLLEPCVLDRGKETVERKGIMAGTPLSSFFANLYLSGLDRHFDESGVIYARYSDDMIVFSPDEAQVKKHAEFIRSFLATNSLTVNPAKENFGDPGDGFVFLGFSCVGDNVDIAPATVKKLKQKMRRKRDALSRWQKRNGFGGEKAAKAFIRIFNAKLLESPRDNELSWSHWFFPVINTTESLHAIDLYAQDCLRYLISGRHTKARFNVRYEDLKALGYRSLVHAYYEHIADANG
ncbi:MAG: group II intron reverse transcriptase domain-containing protein [Clostridia bacterium]|nr:group II intron reverse transcriptase domain-containing protein [Clostridia bacterium]